MLESNTKLRVLIPVYNKEEFIVSCLESILKQKTNFNFDILVIDDGSTDQSLKIIKKYQKEYSDKIKIIKNRKNLGLFSTILKGYLNLKNIDYFTVLDPDDYWLKTNKLQEAVDFLDQNKKFTIYFSNNYLEYKNKKREVYFQNKPLQINFSFKDFSKEKIFLGHTSASVFRNIIFKKDVPIKIIKAKNTPKEQSFRGDTFRNIIHLEKGKAHFENKIESVYRIQKEGIWTKLNDFSRNSFNSQLFLSLSDYFNPKYKNIFIPKSWNFCFSNFDLIFNSWENNNQLDISENELLNFWKIVNLCTSYKEEIKDIKYYNQQTIKQYREKIFLINELDKIKGSKFYKTYLIFNKIKSLFKYHD